MGYIWFVGVRIICINGRGWGGRGKGRSNGNGVKGKKVFIVLRILCCIV